jgi:hypothetical protein
MSKQSARRRPRDGRYLDDYVVEDGGEVRVPVTLCDSMAGHRRGYAELSWREIADRRAAFEARQEMIDRQRQSWRMDKRKPPPDEPDEDDDENDDDDTRDAARAASYQAMCLRLQDAHKRPAQVGPGPAATLTAPSFGPAPLRPVPRSGPSDDDDPQKRRDRVAQEYATTISEAWKMTSATRYPQQAEVGAGPTAVVQPAGSDPQRAVRNERELEAMKGGRDAGHPG